MMYSPPVPRSWAREGERVVGVRACGRGVAPRASYGWGAHLVDLAVERVVVERGRDVAQ